MRHLIRVSVRLVTESGEVMEVMTGNISDCGVYVEIDELEMPRLGSEVTIQVSDTLGDGSEAPINRAQVVRHDTHGIGLKFLFDD